MIGPPHFIDNKYRRWYFQLMERSQQRKLIEHPFERHHVLPKALCGTESCLLLLTFREHFLAHWLLTKFTEGSARRKMNYALAVMSRSGGRRHTPRIVASWQYERAKRASVEALRGRKVSAETKARMSEAARNRSSEYLEKQRVAHIGKKHSADTRAKLSAFMRTLDSEIRERMHATRRSRGWKPTKEMIEKVRLANTGLKRSAETREKLRLSSLGNKSNTGLKRSEATKDKMRRSIKASWTTKDAEQRREILSLRMANRGEATAAAAAKKGWITRRERAGCQNYSTHTKEDDFPNI